MMEATQITHNWMAHHAKHQQNSATQSTSAVAGSQPNSQLSGKCLK